MANNPYKGIKNTGEVDFVGHNKLGEPRRNKRKRKYHRSEAIKKIKMNPGNCIYILLLLAGFIIAEIAILILVKCLVEIITDNSVFRFIGNLIEIIASAIMGNQEFEGLIEEITATITVNRLLMIFSAIVFAAFLAATWKGLLPWIGRPGIAKDVLMEMENSLAENLGLAPFRGGYDKRPFVISYEKNAENSDVEEYIIWSGPSVDKWNRPEIKSELLTTLGGVSSEDFKNISTDGLKSRRKKKEARNIIVARIIPGTEKTERPGLIDDDV